jgi:hypothetical protein
MVRKLSTRRRNQKFMQNFIIGVFQEKTFRTYKLPTTTTTTIIIIITTTIK